uniref:Uncharacterized protein n=1 Tax=viral metagenome TaxID=1070528 RepID=A0A6M3L936_9ZZZZ
MGIACGRDEEVRKLFAKLYPGMHIRSATIVFAVDSVVSAKLEVILDDTHILEFNRYFETVKPINI